MKPQWDEKQVLQSAGLNEEDFTPELIVLARQCLDRRYYIQHAAEELVSIIKGRL